MGERETQMALALDHAGQAWAEEAYRYLVAFARTHQTFISEDVSDQWEREGRPMPPTLRAFGALYQKAQRQGFIVMDGTGRSRRRASICPRWRSLVCMAVAA